MSTSINSDDSNLDNPQVYFFSQCPTHRHWIQCPTCGANVELTNNALPDLTQSDFDVNEPQTIIMPTHNALGTTDVCSDSTQLASYVAVHTDDSGIYVCYGVEATDSDGNPITTTTADSTFASSLSADSTSTSNLVVSQVSPLPDDWWQTI